MYALAPTRIGDTPDAAAHLEVLKVHRRANAGAVAHGQQVRSPHRDAADGGVLPDPRAQRAQVPGLQRRAGQQVRRRDVHDAVDQPPAIEHPAIQRIAAGLEPAQDAPLASHGHAEAEQVAGQVAADRQRHREPDRIALVAGEVVIGEERRQPDQHAHADQDGQRRQLRQAASPAPPLGRAFGHRLARRAGAGHCRLGRQRVQPPRQRRQRGMLVQLVHGQRGKMRMLAQRGHQPRGQQRMAAQVTEEIARQAQRLAGEQRTQRLEQRLLAGGGGQVVLAAGFGRRGQLARLERLAVDLAGRQARHLGHQFETRRDHISRQFLRQARAQGMRIGPRLALGRQEGHQLFDAGQIAQHDGGRAHARLAIERRLDLAQLDAKAAHLHLVVAAAQALDLALLVDARQVAAAVHARIVLAARTRIGQELLGRQLGPPQVAARHARPGDAQLAHLPLRQHRAVLAAYQHAVVGQRRADGDGLTGQQLGQAGRHRGLGGAVGVVHAPARRGPARRQELRAHLAAQVDDAQAGHVAAEQGQQRGHGVQHRHALARQRLGQSFGVGGQHLGRDPERGADQVADPDFLERHVEGHRKALVDLVAVAHAQHFVLAAQEVADAGLGDGHALGLASGTGGVDDVGRMLGQQPARRRSGAEPAAGCDSCQGVQVAMPSSWTSPPATMYCAPASCRQACMRSGGVSDSNGSQAAPALAMAACISSSSSPRGRHRPTISPGRTPASIRWCAARSARRPSVS